MGMVIMNGVEYASAPKDGFPPIIYSDEEREIGVWRDGKPLYSIVISGTASANFDITTGVIPTIDNLVTSHIHIKSNGGTQINNYFMSSSDYARVRMDINPNTLHIDFGSSYPAKPLNYDLMLLYTKTTDTPGSSKYTTYGGLAHHYSETEQVIGTWIDGKPVYERAVKFSPDIMVYSANWVNLFQLSTYSADKIIDLALYNGDYTKPLSSFMSDVSDGYLKVFVYTNWSVRCMILRYTKTTD